MSTVYTQSFLPQVQRRLKASRSSVQLVRAAAFLYAEFTPRCRTFELLHMLQKICLGAAPDYRLLTAHCHLLTTLLLAAHAAHKICVGAAASMLATCYLLPATCYLLACYLLLAPCCLLLATCYLPLATCHLPLATCHLPHSACHLRPTTCTTCRLSLTTCYMLRAAYHLPLLLPPPLPLLPPLPLPPHNLRFGIPQAW